jgi:hypothetical protein
MRRGLRFEKSFDGETTLAATLVVMVATSRATRADQGERRIIEATEGADRSQMASPRLAPTRKSPRRR